MIINEKKQDTMPDGLLESDIKLQPKKKMLYRWPCPNLFLREKSQNKYKCLNTQTKWYTTSIDSGMKHRKTVQLTQVTVPFTHKKYRKPMAISAHPLPFLTSDETELQYRPSPQDSYPASLGGPIRRRPLCTIRRYLQLYNPNYNSWMPEKIFLT
jgi:hypothetical protein